MREFPVGAVSELAECRCGWYVQLFLIVIVLILLVRNIFCKTDLNESYIKFAFDLIVMI